MPSKVVEKYLQNASPEQKAELEQIRQQSPQYGAQIAEQHTDPAVPTRQADRLSTEPGKLSEPVQGHLESFDRQRQPNAVDRALQRETQPQAQQQQEQEKEPER